MSQNLSEFNKSLKKALNIQPMKEPYISMNKLAEYMTASAIRRRQIINTLKKDSDFIKVRYYELRNAIEPYFKSNYDDKVLNNLLAKIEQKGYETTWSDSDDINTKLAINHLKNAELPDISEYEVVEDAYNLKSIKLAGVEVTIKPDIYLMNITTKKLGAVKLHIAKTDENQLLEENRLFASTLLKYAFLDAGYNDKSIDNNACISIDVFQEEYSVSPSSYKRKVDALTAACEEIALRWAVN